ncbi:hypothetical protein WR25_17284 isoform D [Diploscapter pachys]|uniref:DUF4704 domain-containing protein n=2 Tax=Diploscapter pachys TaxID=2018661 RepID=A0A2A2L6C1_9BILA|nr:hypothetical protein WR25_17284 isoform B [Diploscapter pachys]PAV81677.1 hypothetical protein WR25_17284 isoform C [Diploscapter pachys]PAV81678.1 hypothetical protein WR25_17284 isoform D [Diploscapter pachys]
MSSDERTLSLLHLRKTFAEYMKVPVSGPRENDPNRLLPLFTKVMSMYNPVDLKAANEGTIEAASSIADYLQPAPSQHKGWVLISCINYLISTEDEILIDAACKVSLPSTLVKAIYLFFDLPENDELQEPRQRLNELMTTLLDRMCAYKCVAEELARKDDLLLLFVGASSPLSPSNAMWRKASAQLLETLASRALVPAVIKYIHAKDCIATFVNNLKSPKLSSQEAAEATICLLCVLKDTAPLTSQFQEDFIEANGFTVIKDFIFKNENDIELVRNLLLMFISVITSGKEEIRPQHNSGLVQLPTFSLPSPTGSSSIRNPQAFILLYQIFSESENEAVCCSVIDVIHSIYTCDAANYFILEKDYPLAMFIELLDRKTDPIRLKVLELVELAVFQLNHIPCKELLNLCVRMKTELSMGKCDLCIAAVQSAFRLLTVDAIIKDAFREVGLLDTLCYIMNNLYNVTLKRELDELEKKLALLATDLLTVIIKENIENCKMFGDCSGGRSLLHVVTGAKGEWRSSALQLLKQLMLLSSTDQYTASLIQAINQINPIDNLELNTDLLKTVLGVLRESHKVRVQFRKCGGYLSLVSVLLALEKRFTSIDYQGTIPKEQADVLDFIHLIFKVLTISMRFEPSNAKYFNVEVGWESITTVLRLTGAFTDNVTVKVDEKEWTLDSAELKQQLAACHSVFKMDEAIQLGSIPSGMPASIFVSCYLVRLLFNMSLDNYEKMASDVTWSAVDSSLEDCIVSWTSSILVHPGAVLSILTLLPGIQSEEIKWTVAAQYYCALLLKALFKPERTQQIMCQVDMPKHLLTIASKLFLSENHLLLQPFYYLLERLSYHSMQPSQLRHFLRLDMPLCCRNLDDTEGEEPMREDEGGPVPLQRVKALVSMLTPRDRRLFDAPSFVEFDMSLEGFGALFISSLAPMFSPTKTERVFPPINGVTFSSWLYIDTLSDKKVDQHPLRLLTITLTVSFPDEKKRVPPVNINCFCLQISPIDSSLLISTEEHQGALGDLEREVKFGTEKSIRIPLVEVIRPMEWTHLCVVLTKSVLKSTQIVVYLNGRQIHTQKMQYISQTPGSSNQQAHVHAVNAVIGTLPAMRRPSRLRYRIASTFLTEEPLSPEAVQQLYHLQPHYIGNLQTAGADGMALVPEDKIILSLNGAATNESTLFKIRTLHGKIDSEMLSVHLGISPQDNSTPLRIVTNTAAHAPGGGRSFGAVVVGYLGMRTFTPRSVPRLLDSIGGYACIFGLIAMAADAEGLYASLKALASATRANSSLQDMLRHNRAYQTLAILLEEKAHLLNTHILHLVFTLTGTLDTTREISAIPNPQAFEDLLCDLDIWAKSPAELHRRLYEHIYELITDHRRENLMVIRRSPLLPRLLFTLTDMPELLWTTNDIVFNLISAIIQPPCDSRSLLKISQFIASTMPTIADEFAIEASLPFHISELQTALLANSKAEEATSPPSVLQMVYMRNRILNVMANFLSHSSPSINQQMSEHIVRVLGFDWLLSLMSPSVHSGTVYLALRILLSTLAHPPLLQKFRDGSANGGWLADADSVVRNRAAVVLGFSVSAHDGTIGSKVELNPELAHCSGFAALEHLMGAHADKPHTYYAMLSLLVGQPIKDLRLCEQLSVDLVWTHVFGLKTSSSVHEAITSAEFCFDAIIPLFSMIRSALYCGNEAFEGWHVSYPSTVLQMVAFLYQNSQSFFMAAHSEEFILALFSSLIQDTNAQGVRCEAAERRDAGTPEMERAQQMLTLPTSKAVLDMLRKILCDELQIASANRTDSLIDVLIDGIAENGVTRRAQIVTLTNLINIVLEHIVSTDLLATSPLPPNIPTQNIAQIGANISYLCARIADCQWNGLIMGGDVMRTLNCLYQIHAIASRKENKSINVESLTVSTMRCVLFVLSKPIDSVAVQMTVLDALSTLISKRYIFVASNESWFFAALSHLIFMLSVTPDILENQGMPLERASAQVAMCAQRVWNEVILTKKALLEKTFEKQTVSELNAARALLASSASVHWQQFVDNQLHGTTSMQPGTTRDILQQQISSKITMMASGLHRLASKRSLSSHGSMTGTTTTPWKIASADRDIIFMWLRVHISLVRELVRAQAVRYHEWHAHVRKWSLHEWHQLEAELTRERGIWGPEKASKLDKYKLDTTEGPSRVRRKMIPNREFYYNYPYRPLLDESKYKAMRAKVAISHDSKLYYQASLQRRARILDTRIIDTDMAICTPNDDKPSAAVSFTDLSQLNTSLIRRLSIRSSTTQSQDKDLVSRENSEVDDKDALEENEEKELQGEEEPSEESSTTNTTENNTNNKKDENNDRREEPRKAGPDNQTLLRLLEQGEQLHSMFRCARIQGLTTCEGLLLFGREHYYVVDGFTLLKTREIRDLDFLSSELHDPIVPYTATGATAPPKVSKLCSKFSYDDIREVHKRRYLLQPIAIEVFSGDGRNYLLAFPKKIRDRVYEKLVAMAKGLASGGDSISGQRSSMSIEQSGRTSLINSIIGQQSVTRRWLSGQITNFQYLMYLNTLAGRSYNDLSQYPVLPWVLSDYTSASLDFTNPRTFRDLSKPMGAQNEERLEQFLKRYREWDDPTGEVPPYMYGTHYSSAMIVVSYLVRLEPFTSQFLSLQGNHFDLADRMFHCVGDAFMSASKNNMADVKELIPEFYTLPDMFVNRNRFDLGMKQSGIILDDVVLPPWAHTDTREFVRLHRQALESDYVSFHLHEWIDLIFGYKQTGPEAVKANNVFHHLFYEGSVDFESIDDPLTRNATIGFVNNFGQVPTQLFKKPHPQKKVSPVDGYSNTPGVTTARLFYHSLHSLKPPQTPIKELRGAVGSIISNDKVGMIALEQNKILLGTNRYVSWGFPDRSMRIGSIDSEKSQCVLEMCETDELTCVAAGDDRTLFCGSVSGCVSVWTVIRKPLRMKRRRVLDGHTDAITAIVS